MILDVLYFAGGFSNLFYIGVLFISQGIVKANVFFLYYMTSFRNSLSVLNKMFSVTIFEHVF